MTRVLFSFITSWDSQACKGSFLVFYESLSPLKGSESEPITTIFMLSALNLGAFVLKMKLFVWTLALWVEVGWGGGPPPEVSACKQPRTGEVCHQHYYFSPSYVKWQRVLFNVDAAKQKYDAVKDRVNTKTSCSPHKNENSVLVTAAVATLEFDPKAGTDWVS